VSCSTVSSMRGSRGGVLTKKESRKPAKTMADLRRVQNGDEAEGDPAEKLYTCLICEKEIDGYYGRWGDFGTCGRVCEGVQAAKPKY
jgi:hypothetical protein